MKEEGWGMPLFSVGNVLDKGDYKPGDLCLIPNNKTNIKVAKERLEKDLLEVQDIT